MFIFHMCLFSIRFFSRKPILFSGFLIFGSEIIGNYDNGLCVSHIHQYLCVDDLSIIQGSVLCVEKQE